MTLSRTSRILIGFLLLILAAFLWVNYLSRDSGFNLPFLSAAPAPSPEGATGEPQAPSVAPVPEEDGSDIDILDLPFLLDEPPVEEPVEPETPPEGGESAAPGQDARRATVNPFSPIVPRGGGAQAAARAPAPAQQQRLITEVPVPSGPARNGAAAPQAQAPRAPAPAPVTPGGRADGTLPRALPGGTLGGTPGLLRSAIGATDTPSDGLGQIAAVREPEETPAELQQAGEGGAERGQPQPLGRPIGAQADGTQRTPMPDQAPLAAGTSDLSRYLRNNNVRFTGSVIGPVSVGVFRSSQTPAPIVISLGQTLPDTSIVLTDLRGQQAELVLGDNSQILTLELRR